ncbi:unnamed protein product [Prunus armeniaca]
MTGTRSSISQLVELEPEIEQKLRAIHRRQRQDREKKNQQGEEEMDLVPNETMGDLDISTIPTSPSNIVLLAATSLTKVQNKFLEKFFFTQITNALRDKIMQFSQQADESFSEAWEQFNNILIQCPHHSLPILVLMRIFDKALTISSKAAVNNYAGGSTECQTLFHMIEIETQHYDATEKKINLEDTLTQLTMSTTQFMIETKTQLQNQSASIQNLEVQVGQIANILRGGNQGVLPSQPEINPKIQEHVKAITLRNGRPIKTAVDLDVQKHHQQLRNTEKAYENSLSTAGSPQLAAVSSTENSTKTMQSASTNLTPKSYVPPISFPQRLKKNNKDVQLSKFLEIYKKLQITIPFSELEQMLNYGKFLKEILAKRIGLREIKKTTISLQMTDRSLTYPHGILEDVLVKVDRFIFPADFIVLYMEEDVDTSIILSRPFLITGRMIIDIEKEAVDHVVQRQFIADYPIDPLKASLVHEIEVGEEPHMLEMMNSLETKAIPSTIASPALTLKRYLKANFNQQMETFALHDPG